MYPKPRPKATPKTDERIAKLKEAICRLERIGDDVNADEQFIKDTYFILQYAECVLPELALKRAAKSDYLAKVHAQTWQK